MASKRRERRRSCESKVAHATEDEAWREALRLRRVHNGGSWRAYRCSRCGFFHVGRPNARQRQAMNAQRSERQK